MKAKMHGQKYQSIGQVQLYNEGFCGFQSSNTVAESRVSAGFGAATQRSARARGITPGVIMVRIIVIINSSSVPAVFGL